LEQNQKVRKTMERILELLVPPLPDKENDFEIGTTKYTPGACGLSNLGNTCFMNAAVQALAHTPPFTQLMTRLRPVIDLQTRKSMVHNWCNLLDAVWSGTYSSVSPVNLFRDLAEVNPMFRGYAQQDSQECLTTFLNVLHEYLKEESFVDDEAEDIDPIEEKTEPDLQQNGSNNTNGHVNSSSPSIPINKRKKSPTTMASSPGSMSPSKASGSPSRRSQMSRENLYATSPRTHSSMSSSTASTSTSSSRSSSKSQAPMEIDTKKEIPKERKKSYKSIISDIFEGTLLSRVQCCNCGNVSDTREVFFELSVSIPRDSKTSEKIATRKQIFTEERTETPKKDGWFGSLVNYVGLSNRKVDLVDCLHGYCVTDDLTGNNKYKCDNCKKTCDAKKTLSIFKPPEVLCVHLKRFKHDTLFGTKISDTVVFPLDNLDVSPFCVQLDEDEKKKKDFAQEFPFSTNYELVSIVNHRGGYSGGHYVSYCFNRAANKWQEFDDKYVSDVTADDVAGREAYLLFYVKKSTLAQIEQHRLIDQALREKNPNNLAWIPRVWLERWECMTSPGPLSARSIRCKHGLLARHVASNGLSPRLVAVPRTVLKQFAAIYHPRVISQQWREYRQKISKKKPVANSEMNGNAAHDGTQSSGAVNINGTSGSKKKDLKSPSGSVSPRKSIKLSRSPGKSPSHINSKNDKDVHMHLNNNNHDMNGTSTTHEDTSTAALDSIVDWSYLEIKIDSPICNICQDAQTIQKRCDAEKAQITLLDRQEIGENEAWYLINKPWLDDWRAFVLRRTRQEPPGPIDNSILLQSDGAPKQGLKRGVDYRGVTKEVWDYFISIYSGGPSITRKRIDIYDPHYTPPEELLLGKK
jgi:ubiquitin carboxyl-terminal hydrolase 20/33